MIRRTALLALAAALLATGCAAIPTSGPVREGRSAQYEVDDSVVRVLAQPPRDGASPEDIVRGFLIASPNFEGNHASARLYLAPGIQDSWTPDAGVRIYDSGSFEIAATEGEVVVTIRQIATITAEGRFVRAPEPVKTTATFGVISVEGQWRVSALENGLLLTTFDVSRAYRVSQVYFLDPDRSIVVPDTVLLPNRSNLATALANRLLRGPTPWLAPAVETAFPPGASLNVASVPVVGGIAEVDLDAAALTADAGQRQAMSAQLVWTLRQLPEVRYVRITVDNRDFPVPGAAAEQSRESWPNFDPGGLPVSSAPYVLRDGSLGLLDGAEFAPLPGPTGQGDVALARPAISLSGDLVAGVTDEGRTLLRGRIGADEQLAGVLSGGDLGTPSWDRAGNLWVVDRAAGAGTVHVVGTGGAATTVAVDDLEDRLVRNVRIARDGTRAVLIAQRPGAAAREELLVATVVRGEDGRTPARLAGLTGIAPQLVEIRDAAWQDADRVAVVAREDGGVVQPFLIDATGYASTTTSPIDAVSIAAAPGPDPLLVATADGQLYQAAGRSWEPAGPGSFPTYPG